MWGWAGGVDDAPPSAQQHHMPSNPFNPPAAQPRLQQVASLPHLRMSLLLVTRALMVQRFW